MLSHYAQNALKSLSIMPMSNHNNNNHMNTGVSSSNNFVRCDGKDPPHVPYMHMWIKGWGAGHDIPAVRRGYEVYRQVCATCHSMKFIKFRFMVNAVYPEARVKQIAASYDVTDGPNDEGKYSYDVTDGPNDEGEMFTRPAILTDAFPNPYPNQEAAAYSNGGAVPPDLSVFACARHNGPDHLFAILTGYRDPPFGKLMLTGYRDPPFGVHLRAGLYYNLYFPGGAISMPPPLTEDGQVEYEDGTPSTISQMAWDTVQFITWATEPSHDERKLMGTKVYTGFFIAACFTGYWTRAVFVSLKTHRLDFTRVYM